MALPTDTTQIMSAADFRWELRLQPDKPADEVLNGVVKRAVAWIALNTGLPVLPKYETYFLGERTGSTGIAQDGKAIVVGIPEPIRLMALSIDKVDQDLTGYEVHTIGDKMLCIMKSDESSFARSNATVQMSFWRGIHLDSDQMENVKSLIAAIGRELFDGITFRHQLRLTLPMATIVDRIGLKRGFLEGLIPFNELGVAAPELPNDLRIQE